MKRVMGVAAVAALTLTMGACTGTKEREVEIPVKEEVTTPGREEVTTPEPPRQEHVDPPPVSSSEAMYSANDTCSSFIMSPEFISTMGEDTRMVIESAAVDEGLVFDDYMAYMSQVFHDYHDLSIESDGMIVVEDALKDTAWGHVAAGYGVCLLVELDIPYTDVMVIPMNDREVYEETTPLYIARGEPTVDQETKEEAINLYILDRSLHN